MTAPQIKWTKQDIADYWRHPFVSEPAPSHHKPMPMDQNNNANNLYEPSYILLSTHCLDCNYKTKRQRQAEQRLADKKQVVVPKQMPVMGKLELLSCVLKLSDFKMIAQLGKGSFGVVFSADFVENPKRQTPRKVAVKVIQLNKDKKHKDQLYSSFLAEQNARGLRHPNLISQFGFNECDLLSKNAFFVYELGGNINLRQFLIDSDVELTISKRKSMSLDLIKALEYIHSHRIVHMDLKPANVVVTNNLVCKLTDFGCSVKLSDVEHPVDNQCVDKPCKYEDNRWTAGTWFYRAPELFRHEMPIYECNSSVVSFKCDIFSLGIVMWQLLSRESPYHEYHEDPQVIVYQIVTKNLRPKFPWSRLNESKSCQNFEAAEFEQSMSNSSSNNTISSLTNSSRNSSYSSLDNLAKSNSNSSISFKSLVSNVNAEVLAHARSTACLNPRNLSMTQQRQQPDNSAFETVYRGLIEQAWSANPTLRYEAKQIKDILANTKISY